MPILGQTDFELLWAALRALIITIVLTPVCRDVFSSYAIMDAPDDGRKLHGRPIPRIGGIAIFIGYFVSFFLFAPDVDRKLDGELSLVWKVLPAAILIFAVGLIDDLVGLKPWQKLVGQVAAAALAFWCGVRVLGIAGYLVDSLWSFPITIVWLLACTNAFNLVDGLDGLAAGVGLFATLTVFAAALLHGNQALAFATLPLAAALLGFLCFNFNPATIFLGDGGSLLIGFLLGSYGAIWFQKSATLLGVTGPLLAFSIPLLDVLLCIVRRFLRNKPIFSADRGHIHHRLLERGLTPRRAVLVIYAVSGIAATLSLLQSFFPNVYAAAAVLLVAVGAIWAGVRFLGYAEFVFAGRILRTGGFQRLVTAQLELEELRTALAKVSGPDDCWTILRNWYRRLGFSAVTFQVWGAVYRAGDTPGPAAWSVRIPVGDAVIEFAQNASATTPVIVSSLVETFSAIAGKLTGAPVASPRSSIAAQVQG